MASRASELKRGRPVRWMTVMRVTVSSRTGIALRALSPRSISTLASWSTYELTASRWSKRCSSV
jgi:hypothetical protein